MHTYRTAGKRHHAGPPRQSRQRQWPQQRSRQRLWQLGFLAAGVVASLALGGWAAFGGRSRPAPEPVPTRLGVPAYVFPGQAPLVALQAMNPPPGIVILNPGNGDAPFTRSWQAQARRLRARGVRVLGYVHTDGATRPLADAEASIRNYLRPAAGRNHVSGIFLDEMSNACTALPYYARLWGYIHLLDPTAFVAANPGTPVSSCFLQAGHKVANTFVTFEHDAVTYESQFQGNVISPAGTYSLGRQYPASTFWHLVYGASVPQMSQVVLLARGRHAGYVYATDGDLPNPWDSVASYLRSEARTAAAAAARPTTTRGSS